MSVIWGLISCCKDKLLFPHWISSRDNHLLSEVTESPTGLYESFRAGEDEGGLTAFNKVSLLKCNAETLCYAVDWHFKNCLFCFLKTTGVNFEEDVWRDSCQPCLNSENKIKCWHTDPLMHACVHFKAPLVGWHLKVTSSTSLHFWCLCPVAVNKPFNLGAQLGRCSWCCVRGL